MNRISVFDLKTFLIAFLFILLFNKITFSQWYIATSDEHKRIMWKHFNVVVEERQGNFATEQECLDALNNADVEYDQRQHYWCECDCTDQTSNEYSTEQKTPKIIIDDPETQRKKRNAVITKDQKEKLLLDYKKNQETKEELLGKLKGNDKKESTALDQLKTTEKLSVKGEQSFGSDSSRVLTEQAFTDAELSSEKENSNNYIIPVSPPAPIDHNKNLAEYIDRETKIVQTKIMEAQKQKIEILEKKNKIQQDIIVQTEKIETLKVEKNQAEVESTKIEVDSLLLLAEQMLQESEDLNKRADEELTSKNQVILEQESLLNKYQDSLNKSKDNPELSEELLIELQGGKK
jgi:hypothetical protein